MNRLSKYIIPAICIFNILLHLSSFRYLEYHRDELLYFSLANHLDFGYASVPPLISLFAFAMKGIFGFSMFSVKILPALLSGGLIYLSTKIAKELGGDFYAQLLTSIALTCTPLVLRAFILFQPVPFDIFFWTLIYYLILRYINTKNLNIFYILGLVIGFALLNKYLIILQLISIIAILPFTKYRSIFSKKEFYFCIGLALLIASPNIYWQFANGTPLLAHMSQLQETQLQFVSKFTFISEQILMFLSSTVIAILGAYYLIRKSKKEHFWLFPISAFIVIFSLLVLNGKPYYAAGVYPFLIASGAVFISKKTTSKFFKRAIPIFNIATIIPLVPLGIPFLSPSNLETYFDKLENVGIDVGRIHEDGEKHPLPQDFADMLGWAEIAEIAKKAYDKVENKKACAIYAENYGLAGAISLINEKHEMPEALSFSDTYRYWVPDSFDPDITSFIYVNDEMGRDVKQLFDKIEIVGSIDDPLSRQYNTTVYLCQLPNRSFNQFWSQTLKKLD